jgi:hypothetical protein
MNVWGWLNANSGAVQSTLALVTIFVLGFTAWAIKVQADATRALERVADEQTKAAKAAAISAEVQARLTADQLELSTAPLLVFEPGERPDGPRLRVVNRGQGVAFQIHIWQGGFEHFHPRPRTSYAYRILNLSTLASGMFVYLDIDPLWESWTVKYRGIDDQARATTMNRNGQGGQHYIIRTGGKEITLDDFQRRNGEKAVGDWTE